MCPHTVSTNLIFSSITCPDWTVLDIQHDWWTLCKCSGGTLWVYGPYKCGMCTRADCRDGEFSVNTCDWPQRVPCLLWRTDRWRQWEEGKWAAALALHCGWRIEACPQLSDNGDDVRGGRRCRWAGSCPSLASGEVVHSCTGHSCGERWQTASQECSWSHPLLASGNYQTHTHTHTVSVVLLERASGRHTLVTHCSTRQCPLLRDGVVSACWISTAVKGTQATSSQH